MAAPYTLQAAPPSSSPACGRSWCYALAAFLLFAPLYKAGNRPFPMLVLQLAAVGFLFAVYVVRRDGPVLPRSLAAALGLVVGYPLLQLVPLPEALWRMLPGHAGYIAALDHFAGDIIARGLASARHTLSVIPQATEAGWLSLLPPLACLVVVMRLRPEDVTRLLLAMCAFATLEAILGLLQAGTSVSNSVYRPSEVSVGRGRAFGTFVDPNHFAGFIGMTLPLVIGLMAGRFQRRHGPGGDDGHHHLRALDGNLLAQRGVLFTSAILMMLCLVLTWSRAGIATGLIGVAGSALLIPRRRGTSSHTRIAVLALLGIATALALAVGVTPLLDKLDPSHLAGGLEGRWWLTVTTLKAGLEFFPFGSGLSTYAGVFPRFQTEMGGGIDYAHNDYAQFFLELGLLAPIIVGLALAAYVSRLRALLRDPGRRSFTVLQLAAGIGLVPMILHSAFEFGLHMPSIAMWFATLAGVMLHKGASDHPRWSSTS